MQIVVILPDFICTTILRQLACLFHYNKTRTALSFSRHSGKQKKNGTEKKTLEVAGSFRGRFPLVRHLKEGASYMYHRRVTPVRVSLKMFSFCCKQKRFDGNFGSECEM